MPTQIAEVRPTNQSKRCLRSPGIPRTRSQRSRTYASSLASRPIGSGYDKREVDAFRSAVRDTFLGGAVFWVSTPPVRSDDVRGKRFSTRQPGYDMKEVDAFLEAAGPSSSFEFGKVTGSIEPV